ncbi:MAG: type II toxin-antitoxin system VapC family toxin [Spirochaetia bacterium]
MLLLDTNVIAELMRPLPEPRVVAWVDRLSRNTVGITAITVAEILYGIGALPDGARKKNLFEAAASVFDGYLADHVYPFDRRSAVEYAQLVVKREQSGSHISMPDAQIAAICLANHAGLATRNTKDFDNTGITLHNPWVDELPQEAM